MSQPEQIQTPANILLLMSGSIACAKASSLISEWTRQGHAVRVVCTRSVGEFIANSSLEELGAEVVFDDVFAQGQAMEHINLGQWADIVIAAPATSNLINKLSCGIADDAVTTVWQAAYGQGRPMVIVPAMNTRMWRYPATRASVKRLQRWGIHVLPVANGELACGEFGEGRMLEPKEISRSLGCLLADDKPSTGKRILITAGGTRERIDSVRYIGNMSTGRTAARLADELTSCGHVVTWLGAENVVQPVAVNKMTSFYSYRDLHTRLRELLGSTEYDVVIHAAAVSDFSLALVETGGCRVADNMVGKLSSKSDLVLHLKPNPKILDRLKAWSLNPALQVIGFKLTDTRDAQQQIAAIKKQFDNSVVDAVVHNDLSDISRSAHAYRLYAPSLESVHCMDSETLARSINELVRAN